MLHTSSYLHNQLKDFLFMNHTHDKRDKNVMLIRGGREGERKRRCNVERREESSST